MSKTAIFDWFLPKMADLILKNAFQDISVIYYNMNFHEKPEKKIGFKNRILKTVATFGCFQLTFAKMANSALNCDIVTEGLWTTYSNIKWCRKS